MKRESASKTFKNKLTNGELLVATFVKTPWVSQIEILAQTDLDAIVLDGEHAPLNNVSLDSCLVAAKASDLPSLVRIPALRHEYILQALDLGATGVMVPHIRSAKDAKAAVLATYYGPGGRGYSGNTRAAGYGKTEMVDHIENTVSTNTVIAQIEDPEAVESIEEIAAVEGIDCLFVGLMDLTVAYGASNTNDPKVESAIQTVCMAAQHQKRSVGIFLPNSTTVPRWRKMGISFFAIGSDHGCLRAGAEVITHEFRNAIFDG